MTLKMKYAVAGSVMAGALLAGVASAGDLAMPKTSVDSEVKLDTTLGADAPGMDHTLDTKVDATGAVGASPLLGDAMSGESGVLSEGAKDEVKADIKVAKDVKVEAGAAAAVSGSAGGEVKSDEGISAEPEKLEDYMKEAAKPADGAATGTDGGMDASVGEQMDAPFPPEGDDMMGNPGR